MVISVPVWRGSSYGHASRWLVVWSPKAELESGSSPRKEEPPLCDFNRAIHSALENRTNLHRKPLCTVT
jgi:hypothetical protein